MIISTLPSEVLIDLFNEYFDPHELLILAQVSRRFNTLALRVLLTRHITDGVLMVHATNALDVDTITSALSLDVHYSATSNDSFRAIAYRPARPMHDHRLLRELAHFELALSWRLRMLETRLLVRQLKSITLDLASVSSTLFGVPLDAGDQSAVADAFRRLLDVIVCTTNALQVSEGRLVDGDETEHVFVHLAQQSTSTLVDAQNYHYHTYYSSVAEWCSSTSNLFLRSCFGGREQHQNDGDSINSDADDEHTPIRLSPTQHSTRTSRQGLNSLTIQSPMLFHAPLTTWTLHQLKLTNLVSLSLLDLDLTSDSWSSIFPRIHSPNLQTLTMRNIPNIQFRDLVGFLARHSRLVELSAGPGLRHLSESESEELIVLPPDSLPRLVTLSASPGYIVRLLRAQDAEESLPGLRHVSICIDLTQELGAQQFRFQDIERQLSDAHARLSNSALTFGLRVHVHVPRTNPLEWLDLPLLPGIGMHGVNVKSPVKKMGKKHVMLPTSNPTSPGAHVSSTGSTSPSRNPTLASKSSLANLLSSEQLNPNTGKVLRRVRSIHLHMNGHAEHSWTAQVLPRWLALFPALQVVRVESNGGNLESVLDVDFGREVKRKCVGVRSVKVDGVEVLR